MSGGLLLATVLIVNISTSRILPEKVATILSDPLKRERVVSLRDASDVLREAFSQTEACMNHYYEVSTLSLYEFISSIADALLYICLKFFTFVPKIVYQWKHDAGSLDTAAMPFFKDFLPMTRIQYSNYVFKNKFV